MTSDSKLPPFATVLKSREVEDPVNLWVHRPLAYAIVALIYRTPITPNQITLLALLVGFSAAGSFVVGTRDAMVLGGVLLWASAILDGADGILARAKRMISDVGRALDGMCDALVALVTVPAAFYHLWQQHHDLWQVAWMPFAFATAIVHVYVYDYYKESYMQRTNPSWSGTPELPSDVEARVSRLVAERASWPAILATKLYVDLLTNQARVVRWTNPGAVREHLQFPVSPESVRIFRQHNAGPMKLWAAISLAPHSYMMSICAMLDRLDVYLWYRVAIANLVFVVGIVWQRRATRRTAADLASAGLAPQPAGRHAAAVSS
jgi:phosphatidylglycerophosphate synthase